MKAMILAAGRGTRMAPLTDHCPKPLLPLAGKPLIVHHIEKLVAAGFNDIVINHAYLGSMIEDTLGDGRQFQCNILYSAEDPALETAGGIIQALPLLGDQAFLLINGDVWTNWDYARARDIPELIQSFGLPHGQHNQALGFLWLVDNPEHHPKGDFSLDEHGIVSSEVMEQGWTFSGISVLSPRLFADLDGGVRPLAPVLRQAMAQQQILAEPLNSDWVDVGTPQRLQQLERRLLATLNGHHHTARESH